MFMELRSCRKQWPANTSPSSKSKQITTVYTAYKECFVQCFHLFFPVEPLKGHIVLHVSLPILGFPSSWLLLCEWTWRGWLAERQHHVLFSSLCSWTDVMWWKPGGGSKKTLPGLNLLYSPSGKTSGCVFLGKHVSVSIAAQGNNTSCWKCQVGFSKRHSPSSHTPTLYAKRAVFMFNLCLHMFDVIWFDVAQGKSLRFVIWKWCLWQGSS